VTTRRRLVSHSGDTTEAFGAQLAVELQGGDVVLLEAELAAGKTTFVRGLVRGLGGVHDDVSSPTFVLIQSYDCTHDVIRTVHHVDLYRLGERVKDLREIGIEEVLSDQSAIAAVEWPKETIATWIPTGTRVWRIGITVGDDDTRTIEITPPNGHNSQF
jgi:tRNA threonylcarbamoyladenosine biosynthesis protein TsaE